MHLCLCLLHVTAWGDMGIVQGQSYYGGYCPFVVGGETPGKLPSLHAANIVEGRIELNHRHLVGPLRNKLKPLVHTSSIGLVPKPHQERKWRMIVDLSSQFHHSVNDGIWQELTSLSYMKVDEAVIILRLESGAELVKIDLKNATKLFQLTLMTTTYLG